VSSPLPSQPPQDHVAVEVLAAGPGTGDALAALGLPDEVARRWSRFVSPLEVSLLAARPPADGKPADGKPAGQTPAEGTPAEGTPQQLIGAAIVVSRHRSASVKVGGLWTRPGEDSAAVEAALLATVEELARNKHAIAIKVEVDAAAPHAAGAAGAYELVEAPGMAGPAPAGQSAVPAGRFRWTTSAKPATVPYIRQTTDFTCGPSALLMALSYFGLRPAPDRSTEISLWREATTVEGCDPYGMAVTAARHGLDVHLAVTTDDFFLLEGLVKEPDRELRRFIQAEFREQAAAAGIKVVKAAGGIGSALVRDIIAAGRLAIVLVDELLFHEEACPHWIVVHSIVDGLFVIHDPWTEVSAGESWLDAYDLPITPSDLECIARYGDPAYGAVLSVAPVSGG
jgi:hypothetical protein